MDDKIHIRTKNNKIYLSSGNELQFLELCIKNNIKIFKRGKATVSFKKLKKASRPFENNLITLQAKITQGERKFHVKSDNFKYVLNIINFKKKTMPQIYHDISTIKVDNKSFREYIYRTLLTTTNKLKEKPSLNSIKAEINDEQLHLISMNINSLQKNVLNLKSHKVKYEHKDFIIKKDFIYFVLNHLESKRDELEISFDKNIIFIETESLVYFNKLLRNDNFPIYKDLIPKKSDFSVKINKDRLINSLKRIENFKEKKVEITINENNMFLNLNSSFEKLSINKDREKEYSFTFKNPNILTDYLLLLNDKYIKINFITDEKDKVRQAFIISNSDIYTFIF